VTFGPAMPRNADEARRDWDDRLVRTARLWLGNRGVWEAIAGAGPAVSVPAEEADVDRYVEAYGALVRWLTGGGAPG
jgi:glutamate-1-semialdehyde 2,1-aminomutase